jgi:hypothetical protein
VASQAHLVKVPDSGSAGWGGCMQGNALRDHADLRTNQQISRKSLVGTMQTRTSRGH